MDKISENWKLIDLNFYLKLQEFILLNKDNIDYAYEYLAFLENSTPDAIKSLPSYEVSNIIIRWKFLNEDISEIDVKDYEPILNIDGENFIIQKDFNFLSMMQWQNMDELLKQSDTDKNYYKNIHLLLAIVCSDRKSYTYEKALELSKHIANEKMYYLIPNISFFLSNEIQSPINMLTYLKKVEQNSLMEMEAILNKKASSKSFGVGIQSFTSWRMKIFVWLMKSYLKLYRKYLSI